jgi:hypothetical protein
MRDSSGENKKQCRGREEEIKKEELRRKNDTSPSGQRCHDWKARKEFSDKWLRWHP